MSGARNGIGERQNADTNIQLCMATRQAFDEAREIAYVQVALTVVLPTAAALTTLIWPELRPWAAFLGLLVLSVDVLFLDRRHKRRMKLGARLGEEFDHRVLDLPWNAFIVDEHPAREDVHRLAERYKTRPGKGRDNVMDWYPAVASRAPFHLGRIICQRANLRYDAQLRRSYALCIQVGGFALVALILAASLWRNANAAEVLFSLAPVAPVINWACREYYRQVEAATTVERLVKQAGDFWASAMAGDCDEDRCLLRSREFQDAIFSHRSRSPSPLPFLYDIKRLNLEDEMKAAAADFVAAYERQLAATGASPSI